MATINPHTTRANGTVLTATIYNADHVNHVGNSIALNASKLEGATPPVVDGHAAVFDGTSGAALRTSGLFPASRAITISPGTGLTGGGDLSANRTLTVDFSDQATAQTGTATDKVMSPARVANYIDNRLASQAEAEAGSNNVKLITPQRLAQNINARLASQAEAEAGVEATHLMTALRTSQAIAALAQSINLGATATFNNTPLDTGVLGSRGGAWLIGTGIISGNFILEISANGGTNYTQIADGTSNSAIYGILFVKGGRAVMLDFALTTTGPPDTISDVAIRNITPTSGAGNILLRTGSNLDNMTATRFM